MVEINNSKKDLEKNYPTLILLSKINRIYGISIMACFLAIILIVNLANKYIASIAVSIWLIILGIFCFVGFYIVNKYSKKCTEELIKRNKEFAKSDSKLLQYSAKKTIAIGQFGLKHPGILKFNRIVMLIGGIWSFLLGIFCLYAVLI